MKRLPQVALGLGELLYAGLGLVAIISPTQFAEKFGLERPKANTTTAADAVGYAVAGGSDTDSDGFADVLLSSVATDSGSFNNNGAAWLFFGGGL